MARLEKVQVGFMRRILGLNKVGGDGEDGMSSKEMRERLSLKLVEDLIRTRRMSWIGHCARRDKKEKERGNRGDSTWEVTRGELEDERSEWGKMIWTDLFQMGIKKVSNLESLALDRQLFSHATKSILRGHTHL